MQLEDRQYQSQQEAKQFEQQKELYKYQKSFEEKNIPTSLIQS
jgi:hypothetical protein